MGVVCDASIDRACRATRPLKTPRLNLRLLRTPKKPSTALSHWPKWGEVQRPARMTAQPLDHFGCVDGVAAVDGKDDLSGGNFPPDHVQEADELRMAMALHAAADGLALPPEAGWASHPMGTRAARFGPA